jgi:hypothetical protein
MASGFRPSARPVTLQMPFPARSLRSSQVMASTFATKLPVGRGLPIPVVARWTGNGPDPTKKDAHPPALQSWRDAGRGPDRRQPDGTLSGHVGKDTVLYGRSDSHV